VDIVYAPLVPFDSFRAAHRLSQVLGKPLVIDLNDPWALDEMMVYPTWLHRWSDKRTMHRALSVAHGIVMNTPEATNRVVTSFPDLESTVVWTIPNGYASEDFHALSTRREDDVFRIVHTGYLHTEQGLEHRRTRHFRRMLGGMLADVDILPRSHVFLLEAVEDLLERAPDLAPIEVHLAGVLTSADEEVASRSGVVRLHGYVAHSVAVELLQSADLLFLPMHEVTTGRRVGIIPGKTYEYLAARRPILAAIPEGDAHDLLAAAGNASICRPSDVRAIAEAIAAQIQRKRRGEPAARPKAELVNQLEWRCRSRDLARMFDTILWRASSDATQPGSPVALVPHGE
jgi:glycosyltransferase involved in cell wall biosynthesis